MSTRPMIIKNGNGNLQTFVFRSEPKMSRGRVRSKLWQILPAVVGSCMCVPYGIMLGWPSSTYPKLLHEESSPIPISIDQSAMIAGFLMIGNIVGTPFSSWSFLGNKYGILLGLFITLIGWILMWYATSIYFLLGSRLLIGLGSSYGSGQLKTYIKDLCEPKLGVICLKLINFYIIFGVILAYILGYFLSFTDFSFVATVMTAVILIMCLMLPHPPKEYLRFGKIRQARIILKYLKPNSDVDCEIQRLKTVLGTGVEEMSFCQVLRDEELRKKVGIVGLLMFFMQFSGAPATIIYTQIIFTSSNCSYPELTSIAYAVLFFISNFIGVFYFSKINKKICLLISSVSVTLILVLNIAVFYFHFNEEYWRYTSLVTMFVFVFLHSIGLAVVPFMLTQEYFPEKARKVLSHFQLMEHSAFALIITKIFQVLYDRFELYVPFCLFASVSFTCSIFVLIFVPYKGPVLDEVSLIGSKSLNS